jgi:hypothetical protein
MRSAVFWVGSASIACVIVGAACATGNGEPESEDASVPSSTTSGGTKKPDAGERPGFNASLPEDANVDPTPDGGGTCLDPDDPGGSENVAKALADTDDCDNSVKTVTGLIQSAVDVDFYSLSMQDKAGCSIDEDFGSVTSGLELCVFARCKNTTANAVSGCTGGVLATNPATGMQGCCATTPSKAIPQWNCSGLNDSADFLVRVKQASGGPQCIAYAFTYHF